MLSAASSTSDSASASTRAPASACVLTTANSCAESRPVLSSIESGIAILPTSCSGAAWRMWVTASSDRPSRRPRRAASAATRSVCSRVLSSRYSAASAACAAASASGATVTCAAPVTSRAPRARAASRSPPAMRTRVPASASSIIEHHGGAGRPAARERDRGLPHRRAHRARRDGGGLPRPAHEPPAPGGDQDHRPRVRRHEGFRSRFIREARIAAALQHPNIVTVYDAGQAGETLYIAMQFIRGSDLAAILREQGRLRPYRAIDVCRQVASALDAAHGMALIHRDVKPGNVLIEGRRAYLTDFGLTKRSGGSKSGLTQAGELVGTIHYVAPEQIEAGDVDARTDVYSLACLLFHCLVGDVPFSRDTDVAVIYAHLSEAPPRLSAVRPELPAGLDAVIAKGLDKSPERRFQSCSDLMSAARVVIDAAGPLADTVPGRGVPAGGDLPDVATAVGRKLPDGAPTVVPDSERRSRMLLAGLDQ